MEKKYHLIYDSNSNSVRIKNQIQKKINTVSLKKSSIIIVVGGDGFMLHTLKKYYKYKKSFYGLNSGNYGF
jgi:NAD+ kinase